jgi:hypothetical protein
MARFGFWKGKDAAPEPSPAPPAPDAYHLPYGNAEFDRVYNLVFSDNLLAWNARHKAAGTPIEPLFADDYREAALRRFAEDELQDSRYRLLAYNRLRRHGVDVGPAKALGVVIEMPQKGGLDTLAASAFGPVIYINQKPHVTFMEDRRERACEHGVTLVGLCNPLLELAPPAVGPRLPPPSVVPQVRITVLSNAGRHVFDGTEAELERDVPTFTVLRMSGLVVKTIVDRVLAEQHATRH